MTTFADSLKKMDVGGLKTLPGVTVRPAGAVDAALGIDAERVFRHHLQKHTCQHALDVANAAKALDRLPDRGETIHVLMSGNFAGWDYVGAVLRLAAPATIADLYVATLGFSEKNSGELLALLDEGKIGRVWFLCSHYFQGTSGEIFAPLAEALKRRGQHIKALRNHAKLMAIKLTDGRAITIDGSMNLRSCRNVEQCNITNDPDLFGFYAAYVRGSCEAQDVAKPDPSAPPPPTRAAYSQKRAALGVWASTVAKADRKDAIRWKTAGGDGDAARRFAEALVRTIKEWSPVLPPGACVTTPPQGASHPGRYFARELGQAVATMLNVPYADLLARTGRKKYHHPQQSLAQPPYTVTATPPPVVIVVDDLITSGTTMRLSLEALRGAGCAAFGFAYAGC